MISTFINALTGLAEMKVDLTVPGTYTVIYTAKDGAGNVSTMVAMFSGCGKDLDNSAYIPTGDAILMEGQEPEDLMPEEEEEQE